MSSEAGATETEIDQKSRIRDIQVINITYRRMKSMESIHLAPLKGLL